ncbi:MAG: acetylornithine/N-succinyldiaminopimelate aminotransferase [Actinomycetota bacterium]|jgi:acetylornithine/N-succinyldiaminopimelate aminotransferase|nr:acetylornithine/N-succinyldiaminopimelate aminotransferase [Actinomycetota bacterium]MDQ1669999.1 acetylornithine/N-succinyldiaminopimelate aminotransferase [Actinomycetota bacterium]
MSITTRWTQSVMPTYAAPRLALVRGAGAQVWDEDGNSYVDLVAGIATNALGHAHPAVVEAVSRQVATLGHTSNLVANEPSVRLAERLLQLTGRDGKVFFSNSGAEANEAAFKIARRTGRPHLVAAHGAFHGRTLGALALTGQPDKRAPFEPLPAGVSFVPYGDAGALRSAVGPDTAAVFLEPLLGEAGVVPPPEGYLATARQATTEAGALLVLDEVQTGIGRTGAWFAHQSVGVEPDVLTLAKGLGGGLPIGACIAFGDAATLLSAGQHGSTFGGNPVSCAAALAVLDTIERDDLCGHAKRLGERIVAGINELGHPLVDHVRGEGLMLGVVLTAPVAAAVEKAARDNGFLVNAPAGDVVRLVPPLVLTDEQADAFLAALPAVLDAAGAAVDEKGV